MNNNLNYSEESIRNNKKKKCNWLNQFKAKAILLIVSVTMLGLLIFLMIKYIWILWIYVVVSLLTMIGFTFYRLFAKKNIEVNPICESDRKIESKLTDEQKNDSISLTDNSEEQSISKSGIETKLEEYSGEQQNLPSPDIDNLKDKIRKKDDELNDIKRTLTTIEKEFTLGNKYKNILIFIQDLDRYIDDLSESEKDFKEVVKKRLSSLLSLYGYKFLDFRPEYSDLYDCEYYPIKSEELVGRTIVDNNDVVVLKGKIYLPENYDK